MASSTLVADHVALPYGGVPIVFIVDDGTRDPGVERLLQLPHSVKKILLSEVLLGFGCQYSQETRLLYPPRNWSDDGLNLGHATIIDRVIEVSDETVMFLTNGKGGLSRGQVSFCYEKLLRARNLIASPNLMYSTIGKVVPLVAQWTWVRAALPGVETPDFVHGYGPEVIDTSHFQEPIYTTPLNLYQWRPNTRPEGEVWDAFVVNRPRGRPVVTTVLGDEIAHNFLDANVECGIPHALAARLTLYAGVLKRLFASRMGEALWFIEDDHVAFASYSHALYASARLSSFDEMAFSFLASL